MARDLQKEENNKELEQIESSFSNEECSDSVLEEYSDFGLTEDESKDNPEADPEDNSILVCIGQADLNFSTSSDDAKSDYSAKQRNRDKVAYSALFICHNTGSVGSISSIYDDDTGNDISCSSVMTNTDTNISNIAAAKDVTHDPMYSKNNTGIIIVSTVVIVALFAYLDMLVVGVAIGLLIAAIVYCKPGSLLKDNNVIPVAEDRLTTTNLF